jgi:glutamine amidotransferase
MSRTTIGIVDYGVGNHASVWRTLHNLGYRCRISDQTDILDSADLLLLPGVGAFPPAMAALNARGLSDYLRQQASRKRPILGICLGMQLLADASHENVLTAGLGLIPGEVVPLVEPRWHIGWNTIELVRPDPLFQSSEGQSFYFNHSHTFSCADQFQACRAQQGRSFPVAIQRGKVIGLQFHPEKSQAAGRQLLRQVIEGLCNA